MTRLIRFVAVLAGVALLGGAATLAVAGGTPQVAGAAATERGDDVKGPCDEPEHAGDPECAGPQVPEDRDDDRAAVGDDVKGAV